MIGAVRAGKAVNARRRALLAALSAGASARLSFADTLRLADAAGYAVGDGGASERTAVEHGVPRDDPSTGHRVRRVTGEPGTPVDGVDALWSTPARHLYSKVAAWDASDSLLAIRNAGATKADGSGAREWLLLDGESGRVRGTIDHPFVEMRWWNTRPGRMLLLADDGLYDHAPLAGSTRAIDIGGSLFERFSGLSLANEGNLSDDDTRLALLGTRREDDTRCLVLLDFDEPEPLLELPLDYPRVDFASVSPSGELLVVNGELAPGEADRSDVLELSGERVGERWHPYGTPSHYDLTRDARGRDIAVGVAKTATDGIAAGSLVARRLRDGGMTVLLEGGYAVHTSCRNLGLPGWAFVSYSGRSPDYPRFADELVAVRTDGSGSHRRLCRFEQVEADYWAQPQACPDTAGTRAVFATNAGKAGGAVQARVVDTRLDAG